MNWNHIISSTARWRPLRRDGIHFVAAAVLLLNGCAMAETAGKDTERAAVPAGAIPVGPELYMVPKGDDETGCPMFQPWSPTLMVVQALHWRAPDGSFTLDRDAADCPPREEPAQNGRR
jgi:hypothetical protein